MLNLINIPPIQGGSSIHPIDSKYAELKADLEVINPGSQDHNIISKYLQVGLCEGRFPPPEV